MGAVDDMAKYDSVADNGVVSNGFADDGVVDNVVATSLLPTTTVSWAMIPHIMGAVDGVATYNMTADNGVANAEFSDDGVANDDCVLGDGALDDGCSG